MAGLFDSMKVRCYTSVVVQFVEVTKVNHP